MSNAAKSIKSTSPTPPAATRRAALALAMGSLCALAGCGGGGSDPAAAPAASPPPPPPPPSPPAPPSPPTGGSAGPLSVAASLASGTYLEFLATSTLASSTPSGSSTTEDQGFVRLTLGEPRRIGGIAGYSAAITGKSRVGGIELFPPWTFLAQVDGRWWASDDGVTLALLYDPAMPDGTTGFFLGGGATRPLTATAGRFEGDYNRFNGVAVGSASSDGGCRWVLDNLICSRSTTSFSQREVWVDGLGPVGFQREMAFDTGGAAPQTVRRSLRVELVRSSLAARDGTPLQPPPWSAGPALPEAREGATAVTFGGQVYVFGGLGRDASFDARRIDRLDPATGRWQRLPDAPRSLAGWHATVLGERIALFGGVDGLLFEPATGRWTATARLLSTGTITGVGTHRRGDGRLEVLAMADRGSSFLQAQLVRYLPDTNQWQTLGSFERGPRANYTAVLVEKRFLLIGGFGSGSYVRTVTGVDVDTLVAAPAGSLLEGVVQPAVARVGNRLAVAGGYNAGGERRGMQWLDPATGQVQAGPGLLAAVQGAAGAEAGGALLILGGRTGDGRDTVTDAVWTLRP